MNKPKSILGVEVKGVGIGLPARSFTNQELLEQRGPIHKDGQEITQEDMVRWTGVESRYICEGDETLLTLLESASIEALTDAGLQTPHEIGKLLVGTATSHKYREVPAIHPTLQHHLSARGYQALASEQANSACASFVNRWIDAYRHFPTGEIDNVLVVGGDTVARLLDPNDADTLMMADGAAAVYMEEVEGSDSGLISWYQAVDGSCDNQLVAETRGFLEMRDGSSLARESVRSMIKSSEQVLEWAGVTLGEVDVIVPHQASGRIIEMVRKKLDIDPAKLVISVDEYGNTSSGSVPMAIHKAVRSGLIERGKLVLAASVGTGLSTETALVRW